MMEIIKQRTNKVALLDMETRWGSTYCMLNRIIDLRAIVDEYATCGRNDDLKMTVYQWQQAIQEQCLQVILEDRTVAGDDEGAGEPVRGCGSAAPISCGCTYT